MPVPSQMPIRHFPRGLRARIRVAYAVAWEAIVETHAAQAHQFIGEFASRTSPLEALELYFAVVPVPEAMQEPVRTRTLATLELDDLPIRSPLPTLRGWRLLRLDLAIKVLRFRRAYHERTLTLARMVGARAAEAVTATHVNNAHAFAELLEGYLPVERAVEEYLRAFYLPLGAGQVVLQRVKAALAGSHLAAEYAQPRLVDPELMGPDPESNLRTPPQSGRRSSPSVASA
ncbi:MAG TPA: hypothetical protein VMG41_08565 [Gemmatimonadales bacterium]|nr:hypothetical protein [Gemmatimonadales bacterium]